MRARRSRGPARRGGARRGRTETTPLAPMAPAPIPQGGPMALPDAITVAELARRLGLSGVDVIKQLMRGGVMASLPQVVDYPTAARAAQALGFTPSREEAPAAPEQQAQAPVPAPGPGQAEPEPRPPVVTILGHVDHGKTSLLDAIRKTQVAEGEAGGITQHIGAYQVAAAGQRITFLDTPGHAAFTAMRARGARGADIAVLVVAADDGIMPQTIEAIDHARAAGVPLIVAINKTDKPEAQVDRVKRQLMERGLLLEEYGGEVIAVSVSAKTGQGLQALLDNILVVAEVAELRADPKRPAAGVILEAHVDRSRGPVATVLVQNGTLHAGDSLVAGDASGRVKALSDDAGARVRDAGPSTPVEVLGLQSLPQAGDPVLAFPSDKAARAFLQQRQAAQSFHGRTARAPLREDGAAPVRELSLILKTDVQGSVEPIRNALDQLSTPEARIRILHAAAGSINDSDLLLAIASRALVLGFNVAPEPGARALAATAGVQIRLYSVIYALLDDAQRALAGILTPAAVEVVEGHAEVRATFPVGRRRQVAGCYVTDGRIARGAQARLLRAGKTVGQGPIDSLRRFKDDAREVTAGLECGITIGGLTGFQPGDTIEAFRLPAP